MLPTSSFSPFRLSSPLSPIHYTSAPPPTLIPHIGQEEGGERTRDFSITQSQTFLPRALMNKVSPLLLLLLLLSQLWFHPSYLSLTALWSIQKDIQDTMTIMKQGT